jgi:hypothetical protein
MAEFFRDLRFGIRLLAKSTVFTLWTRKEIAR